ncbi:MAG: helix-turn-helix transcriptional regulator [Firmicutes bacterium]|nr:helix-turn-helix transcriptional regulator [Bacillota bacterium]
MKIFSERLKELRIANGFTQKQVAQRIGLTKNALGNYEADIREPSLLTVVLLCDFFEVSADYLLGRSDSY